MEPQFFQNSYYRSGTPQFSPEKRLTDTKSGDHFIIEDLLDFSNEDAIIGDEAAFDTSTGNSTDTSIVTVLDSCNSSLSGSEPHFPGNLSCRNFADAQFSGDLCVPYDDLAELEWLSNFVEESFSSDDLQKLELISGMKARSGTGEVSETREFQQENNRNNSIFLPEMSVPGKARSKRSRAAPCNWSSRLLVVSPSTTSSSESDIVASNSGMTTPKSTTHKKKENSDYGNISGDGRKCLHCATEKTPQWRTGPKGPKTLCNACGVRFKSGRLVPEYRPAASPTFVLTKHSNSHRKVVELQRQKEMQMSRQQQFLLHPNTVFDLSPADEYFIHHHHCGSDFQQPI